MISIRVSTNNADNLLQIELTLWMRKHRFVYDHLTHYWNRQMPTVWQFFHGTIPAEPDWMELFKICMKFDAHVSMEFNQVNQVKTPRG